MKKKKLTMDDVLAAPTKEESEELLKQFRRQNIIHNFFNFLIGHGNEGIVDSSQVGKPPYY